MSDKPTIEELNQAVLHFKEAKRKAWELLNAVLPIGKPVVTIRGCNAVQATVFAYVTDSPDYVYLQNDKNERGMFPVDTCCPVEADPERALPDDVTEANDRREMVGNRDSRRDGI